MTFHPDQNLPGCMMPDGGECCAGHTAVVADWHKQRTEIEKLTYQLVTEQWQPIETAPKDRQIRVWSWGHERHATWNLDEYAKKPKPYWSLTSLGPTLSRAHQPMWWMPCGEDPELTKTDEQRSTKGE